MNEVIKIENLSKVYKRKTKRHGVNIVEDFWALKDLSFSVNRGDVLGVIGKNGAGKSTLLKILSRITSPSSGQVTINGRVASLLEVGTGFHPEMTGRENIYMNGSILGMSTCEIKRKFDEIVDFSGVAHFLETPVKRYSSGMQTRLAFAVAAHLEPEVLIIDEVLAVGDAEFQKKCLRKMEDIGNSGRTILFVSHNMIAIKKMCNRCIWLKDGSVYQQDYDAQAVVRNYMNETVPSGTETRWNGGDFGLEDNPFVEFVSFCLRGARGEPLPRIINGSDEVYVNIELLNKKNNIDLQIGFVLYDSALNMLFLSYNTDNADKRAPNLSIGRNILSARLPVNLLNDDEYHVQLIAGVNNSQPILSRLDSKVTISFTVDGNSIRSNSWNFKRSTMIAPILEWNVE
jgi:lipopolysaccharide transport system ATP-binding protein